MPKYFTPGGSEIFTSRRTFIRMVSMPYGMWTCEDGREVLFNRFYEPIWQRIDSVVTAADPHERVGFARQHWFYEDAIKWDGRASRAAMEAWGLPC